jgi:predicted NUDIX family NTP pyrophosphohydrolase
VFRRTGPNLEVILDHPGGPFWAKKDSGSWSLPKGEFSEEAEDPLAAAQREFAEETGFRLDGRFLPLGAARQRGGKTVTAWAIEADLDPLLVRSNTFSVEWPPKSGRTREFPEIDKAQWFTLDEAREKILDGQLPFLDRLAGILSSPTPSDEAP